MFLWAVIALALHGALAQSLFKPVLQVTNGTVSIDVDSTKDFLVIRHLPDGSTSALSLTTQLDEAKAFTASSVASSQAALNLNISQAQLTATQYTDSALSAAVASLNSNLTSAKADWNTSLNNAKSDWSTNLNNAKADLSTNLTVVNLNLMNQIAALQASLNQQVAQLTSQLNSAISSINALSQSFTNFQSIAAVKSTTYAYVDSSVATEHAAMLSTSQSTLTAANAYTDASFTTFNGVVIGNISGQINSLNNTKASTTSLLSSINAVNSSVTAVSSSLSLTQQTLLMMINNNSWTQCADLGWLYSASRGRCEPSRAQNLCPSTVGIVSNASSTCSNVSFSAICVASCNSGFASTPATSNYSCNIAGAWVLQSTPLLCLDINECASNNGGCEATCTNTVGSFVCSCPGGLVSTTNPYACQHFAVTWLPSPQNARFTSSGSCVPTAGILIPGVPTDGSVLAVIATITTYNNQGDHVVHSFGRNWNHNCVTWDNQVYLLNAYLNDVLLTNNGESGGRFYYAHSHGSHVIGVLSDGSWTVNVNMGYSFGTHWITAQVFGYITGYTILPSSQIYNFLQSTTAANTAINGLSFSVPSSYSSSGFISSVSMFTTSRNDDYVNSFGRNNAQTNYYNDIYYNSNAYFNDFQMWNQGDSAGLDYFGFSHGTGIVPQLTDGTNGGTFTMYSNDGKNDNTNPNYLTMQVIGFIPKSAYSNMKFLPSTQIGSIKLASLSNGYVYNIAAPAVCNIPSTAKALITTINTYHPISDHMLHSFGRYANHASYTWDNQVYNLNAYLNDILITNEGDLATAYYAYGNSFGTQIIPLKANGLFDAQLGMGHNGAATQLITIQIYGYTI